MTTSAWLKLTAAAWKFISSRPVLGLIVASLAIATLRLTACRDDPAGIVVRPSSYTAAPNVVVTPPPAPSTEDWPVELIVPSRGTIPALRPSEEERAEVAEQIHRRDLVEPVPVVAWELPAGAEPGTPPTETVVMVRRELLRTFELPRMRWGGSGVVTLSPAGDEIDVDLIAAKRPRLEWLARTRVGGAVGIDEEVKEFGDRWRAWVRHDLFRVGPVEFAVIGGWENRLTRSGWYVEVLAEAIIIEAVKDRTQRKERR